MNRRALLQATALGAAATGLLAGPASAAQLDQGWAQAATAPAKAAGGDGQVAVDDGARLYLRDWLPADAAAGRGTSGSPLLFLSGWGLTAEMWGSQMLRFVAAGHRCLAYDRRGHGRSVDGSGGHGYDRLADDLAAVIAARDLRDLVLVGHSMSAGEIVRYLSRHGAERVARVVLVAPTTPCLAKGPDNPAGVDPAYFEAVRADLLADYPKWLADNEAPFFVAETSPQTVEWLKGTMLQTSMQALIGCQRSLAEADFRSELRQLDLPLLVVQGDRDASAPLPLTGQPTAALVPGARLIVYAGAPHGLFITHAERLAADILAFVGG